MKGYFKKQFKVRNPMSKKFNVKDSVMWNKAHRAVVIQVDVDLARLDGERGYMIEFEDPSLCPPQMSVREGQLDAIEPLSTNGLRTTTGQGLEELSVKVDVSTHCPLCQGKWTTTPSMNGGYWYDCSNCNDTKENIVKKERLQ